MIAPHEVLDEIRARLDLVDLIGAYVPLRRAGERWKGLCPFHQEKTPSFTVHPRLGIFHCFGCHAGGDAFEFLRRHDRLDFPEAVRLLAERTGVPLPVGPGPRPESGEREALLRTMEWAANLYERWLWERGDAERARRYLLERGIDPDVARRFRLGYAPEGWDHLLTAGRAAGLEVTALAGTGLALPRQTGTGHYDRFRGRLLFPIADGQGRVVALGGRALGGEEPKYLNSPETPLYQKGQTLYALHLGRDRMMTARRALVVEGYIDCLMAHQAGFPETVAVLGTALTPHHLGLLRRYADEVVLFFDADRAGTEAARRAEALLDQSSAPHWWALDRRPGALARGGLRLRVATLPAGDDPDTFLRRHGTEAFDARAREARSLLLYAVDRIFAEEDATGIRGRSAGAARVALLLSKVQDADEAIALGREAARRFGIDPSDLWNQAQRLAAALARPGGSPAPGPPALSVFDRDLAQLLLQVMEARVTLLPVVEIEDVVHAGLRRLLAVMKAHPTAGPETLGPRLPEDADRALLARLLVEERDWGDPVALAEEMRRRLERRHRHRRIRAISQAIAQAEAQGTDDLAELQASLESEARRDRQPTVSKSDPREDARS